MRVTNLTDESGYWTATISGVDVDRKYGSWQIPADDTHRRRDVLPDVAAALQARVRKLERKAARGCN